MKAVQNVYLNEYKTSPRCRSRYNVTKRLPFRRHLSIIIIIIFLSWVFVLDQWVFVLDQWVFVLDQ